MVIHGFQGTNCYTPTLVTAALAAHVRQCLHFNLLSSMHEQEITDIINCTMNLFPFKNAGLGGFGHIAIFTIIKKIPKSDNNQCFQLFQNLFSKMFSEIENN